MIAPKTSLELLPCPFCGCTDIRHERTVTDATVWCSSCGAKHKRNYLPIDDCLEIAKSNWNARARSGVQSRDAMVEAGARIIDGSAFEPSLCGCPSCVGTRDRDQEFARQRSREILSAALSVAPDEAVEGRTAEDIYANAYTTLIGFRDELTEDQIKFICDQISRKVALALPSAQSRDDVIEECAKIADAFAAYEQTVLDRAFGDEALSETGRESVVSAAGSRQVAAEQIAHDIRALAPEKITGAEMDAIEAAAIAGHPLSSAERQCSYPKCECGDGIRVCPEAGK